jgi:hypothetical protein
MAALRLLAAPIDPSRLTRVESQFTNLVPSHRLALASRKAPSSEAAYADDTCIWTASAASDGSFTFYAVPQNKSGNNDASSQWDGEAFTPAWNTQMLRYVAAQYALTASELAPMHGITSNLTGSLVNVYA